MRRLLSSLCVLALAGCPSPPPPVTRFCRGHSITTLNFALPLQVEGVAQEVTLSSPLGFCEVPLEDRRVTLELLDENSASVTMPPPTLTVSQDGLTLAKVTFTLPAGVYQLRAVFEPSLGVLTQQVVVATNLRSAGTVINPPPDCQSGPYLLSGHYLCLTTNQALVLTGATWQPALTWTDLGLRFLVTDEVLWAGVPNSVVERYAFNNAGVLTRTHAGTDLGFDFGEVGDDFAIRADLLRTERDGGFSHEALGFQPSNGALYEGDAGFRILTPQPSVCVPNVNDCRLLTEGNVWGVSRTAVVAARLETPFIDFDGGVTIGATVAVLSRPVGHSSGARTLSFGSPLAFDFRLEPGHALTATLDSDIVAAVVERGSLHFFDLGEGTVRATQPGIVTLNVSGAASVRVVPLK